MSRPLLSVKEAILPLVGGALIIVWTMAGAALALRNAGWQTAAQVVAVVALPLAAFGVAGSGWATWQMLQTLVELRRQLAGLKKQAQDGETP